MARLVECLISAQVMISQFVGLSPTSGSVLTAQSLEPASDSVSPSVSAPPQLALCLSVSLSFSKINKTLRKIKNKKYDLLSTCYLPGTVLKVFHNFLTGSLPRACEVFCQAAHSRGHRSPCGPCFCLKQIQLSVFSFSERLLSLANSIIKRQPEYKANIVLYKNINNMLMISSKH